MQVGSLIVCIDDQEWPPDAHENYDRLPLKGQYYHIRRIIENIEVPYGPVGIALEGIFGGLDFFETFDGRIVFEEFHFRKNRFVEVLPPINESISNETDIATIN